MPFCSGRCHSAAKLPGKTAIITGSNTGIGKETALDFYKRGAKVIMACRSLDKTEQAKTDIENACKGLEGLGELKISKCDLSSMKSIREFAQNMLDTEPQINILVNNAGVMMCPYTETEDGFEMQIGTNHLGHFLLTMLLLPRIKNSTPARIVTVSSTLHTRNVLHLDDLNWKNTTYKPMDAYVQSKLANVMFSRELDAKLKEHKIEGVNTYSLHPGVIKTELTRHLDEAYFSGLTRTSGILLAPFQKNAEEGAQTTIYCALDEKCANETGLYYSDCVVKSPTKKALKDELSKKLWDTSMELVGLSGTNPLTTPDPGVKAQ